METGESKFSLRSFHISNEEITFNKNDSILLKENEENENINSPSKNEPEDDNKFEILSALKRKIQDLEEDMQNNLEDDDMVNFQNLEISDLARSIEYSPDTPKMRKNVSLGRILKNRKLNDIKREINSLETSSFFQAKSDNKNTISLLDYTSKIEKKEDEIIELENTLKGQKLMLITMENEIKNNKETFNKMQKEIKNYEKKIEEKENEINSIREDKYSEIEKKQISEKKLEEKIKEIDLLKENIIEKSKMIENYENIKKIEKNKKIESEKLIKNITFCEECEKKDKIIENQQKMFEVLEEKNKKIKGYKFSKKYTIISLVAIKSLLIYYVFRKLRILK